MAPGRFHDSALQAVLPPTAEWTYMATLRRRGAALLSVTDATARRLFPGQGGLRGAGGMRRPAPPGVSS